MYWFNDSLDDLQPDNPALTTALKAFSSLTREQKAALSRTLEGFISTLAPEPGTQGANQYVRSVISEDAWQSHAEWSSEEWNAWETWGWYRQFCRAVSSLCSIFLGNLLIPILQYAPYLRNYSTTLWTVSFSRYHSSTDPAIELLIRTWNRATGQEG